ncbi:phage tail tape measure protein [Phreatobacter sp.]|uniref:phage tail tape measure protein n=1 Tax=Phreatobacter sp. TaxID=1966341 RepID=UPI0022C32561|nr:phage tail tape measure protein [Phreatobacter sp.]MCZ8314356.1 phage tail tape measure protein [Phreatobacter sp.]
MTAVDTLSVEITADTSAFRRELGEADKLARGFGASMSRAFANAVVKGQDLGTVVQSLGQQLSAMALRAAIRPITDGLFSGFQDLMMGFRGLGQGITAEAGPLSGLTPMARGGVVAAPTYFPLAGGRTGLMGERGAEAVMPLARTADGRLGVAAGGGGAAGRPAVVVNVTATDAGSFRRSEAEVTAMLARAVARGRRQL